MIEVTKTNRITKYETKLMVKFNDNYISSFTAESSVSQEKCEQMAYRKILQFTYNAKEHISKGSSYLRRFEGANIEENKVSYSDIEKIEEKIRPLLIKEKKTEKSEVL